MGDATQYRWAKCWQAAPSDSTAGSGAAHALGRVLFIAAEREAEHQAMALAECVEVDWVFDVYAARDRAAAASFDAMILDVPATGVASDAIDERAMAELCEFLPALPLLVLVRSRRQGADALRRGAHGFVVKSSSQPVDCHVLMDAACMAMELHRCRRELGDMSQRLLHTERLASLGQLAAGVAHEINNPAALLLANLTAMKNQLASGALAGAPAGGATELSAHLGEWADILDESIAGLGQIRSIVRDLRNFSRVEGDDIEAVDMGEVIETACKLSEGVIRPRARLIKDLAPVPAVHGDRNRLVQVFTNLLTNAAHAIDGPRRDNEIRVATAEREGCVIASVEDTGRGIPASIGKLVFEPFFTTKPRDQGTGLGLALSAEIVHRYGGDIGFAALAGGGTRFEVRLVPGAIPAGVAPPCVTPAALPAQRARVLLVDDEPGLLRAFRRVLAPQHDVVMAMSGQQALDILAGDTAFDGVICDFTMPDLDGIGLYEAVARRDSDLAARIVFCTGGPMSHRGRRFIESTRNTVLEKPVPPDLLLDAIEQLVKRPADQPAAVSAVERSGSPPSRA